MRIIGGTHRHRRILPPEDDRTTRPITDRVKQSLFDRLTVLEAMDGPVLDLFSGTGSLGVEALSREACHCTFIERDRKVRLRLQRNLHDLDMLTRSHVLGMDILGGAWMAMLPRTPLGLIFVDPPYRMTEDAATMGKLGAMLSRLARFAVPEAVMVIRTSEQAVVDPIEPWVGPDRYAVGSQVLHLFMMPPPVPDPGLEAAANTP